LLFTDVQRPMVGLDLHMLGASNADTYLCKAGTDARQIVSIQKASWGVKVNWKNLRSRFVRASLAIALLSLGACAFAPVTKIHSLEPRFTDASQRETLGIVKFEIYLTEPPDFAENVASSAAAAAGGLVGGLVYIAIKDAQGEKDYSIEVEAVRLYEESFEMLVERLQESELVEPIETACGANIEPVSISRQIRKCRLYGSSPPTPEVIEEFVEAHSVDYALYSAHHGYDNPSGGIVLQSNWEIYDKSGTKVVTVMSRSVDQSAERRELPSSELTNRYIGLFKKNMEKFFAATAAEP